MKRNVLGHLMDNKLQTYNQKILTGCAVLILLAVIAIVALMGFLFQQARQASHYPGSRLLNSNSNYTRLPKRFKWDETYLTTDEFPEVYNWYSHTFDLRGETAAMEGCIFAEGTSQQWFVNRYTSLILCDTRNGQMAFVSRTTWFGD